MARNSNKTAKTEEILEEVEEKNEEIKIEETKEIEKEVEKPLDMREYIEVRSVTEGSLSYTDTFKGIKYLWRNFGSIQKVPFEVLQSMMSMYPSYFDEPNIIITDKRVIRELNLEDTYANLDMEIINDLDSIFTLSSKVLKNKINELSDTIKDNLKIRAFKLIEKNKLNDYDIIKTLEKELKIDLQMMNE